MQWKGSPGNMPHPSSVGCSQIVKIERANLLIELCERVGATVEEFLQVDSFHEQVNQLFLVFDEHFEQRVVH